MHPTTLGQFASDCWHEIPQHFPFVQLGPFTVMPNHIHGIIVIAKDDRSSKTTQDVASLPSTNRFGPQSQNLASIVRGYKIGVTKSAKTEQLSFKWHRRYYDRVIRNAKEYQQVERYIDENIGRWHTQQAENQLHPYHDPLS